MISKIKTMFITLFGGVVGFHKFFDKKPIEGIIYLFTIGLGLIGWIIDVISSFLSIINVKRKTIYIFERITSIIFGILYILIGVSNFGSNKSDAIFSLVIGSILLYIFNNKSYIETNEKIIEEEKIKKHTEQTKSKAKEKQEETAHTNINNHIQQNNSLLIKKNEKKNQKISEQQIENITTGIDNQTQQNSPLLIKVNKKENSEEEVKKIKEQEKFEKYKQYRENKIKRHTNKKMEEEFNNYCEKNYGKLVFTFYNILSKDNNYKIDFNNNLMKVKFDEVFYKVFKKYNITHTIPKDNYYYKIIKEILEISLPLNIDENNIKNATKIVMDSLSNDYDMDVLNDLIYFHNMKYTKSNDLLFTKKLFSSDNKTNEIIYQLTIYFILTKELIKVIDIYNKYNDMDKTNPFYRFITNIVNKYVEYDEIIKEASELYKESFKLEMNYFDFSLLIYILSESKKFEIEKKSLNFGIQDTVKENQKNPDKVEKFSYEFDVIINNKKNGQQFIFSDISKIITELCRKYSEDGVFYTNKKEILRQIFYCYTYKRGVKCLIESTYQFPSWNNKLNEEIKKYRNIAKTQRIINNNFEGFDTYTNFKNKYKDVQDGNSFENFLVELFKELGYKTNKCGHSGDQGGDLEMYKNNIKYIVQAKHYSNLLDNTPVQEVLGAQKYYNADKCIVITNNMFTKGAIKLAKVNEVILIDGNKLEEIIELLKNKKDYKYVDIFSIN